MRNWRLKYHAAADSLDEDGAELFTSLRYPLAQWKSLRTANAIKRLHYEFRRQIKIRRVVPCGETARILFWALLASGRVTLREVDCCAP